MIDCPICLGNGELKIFSKTTPTIKCHFCEGLKQIEEIHLEWIEQGKMLKNNRISSQLTLKEAATLLEVDVLCLSDMENGKVKPNMDLINYI